MRPMSIPSFFIPRKIHSLRHGLKVSSELYAMPLNRTDFNNLYLGAHMFNV